MEALGAGGSIIAVVELSATVASLCLQYSKDVKHAKDNIIQLRQQVIELKEILASVAKLLDGPNGSKLEASQQLRTAIRSGRSQLEGLHERLSPKTARQAMSRLGLRSLKWPFEIKDTESIVQSLMQCNQAISLALQVDQTSILLDIDQKIVLDRLPIAEGASFDSFTEQHKAICLPTTRVDLLQQIYNWADDPEADPVFWLNGMAGTGKSTISRTIAQSFDKTGYLGASFFFKRGQADRGRMNRLFTTIAAQLVVKEPTTASHIKDVLDADPSILMKNAREQFDKLIQQPLLKAMTTTNSSPIVIVVDALDECEPDADIELIIRIFSRVKSKLSRQIKIFLTSRPDLPPRLGFQAIEGTFQDIILHQVPKPMIERDIFLFLEHQLAAIRNTYNNSVPVRRQCPQYWPDESDIQSLTKMAAPLFIFAATVCLFIGDRKYGNPEKQLLKVLGNQTKSHGSVLNEVYLLVLNQQIVGFNEQDQNEALEEFRNIVGPIVILETPLSTSALAQILDISEGTISDRLDMLHSVLNVPQSSETPVTLLHLSFREFLLDSDHAINPFWIDEKTTHAAMATNCLRILEYLKQDICDIKAPEMPRSGISAIKINACVSPAMQYACQYWIHHVKKSEVSISDSSDVFKFLTKHFLHWTEALSLIDKLSESLSLIRTLQSQLDPQNSAELSQFLNDATRFLRTYMSAISSTPLQLYSSLLLFTPKGSKVKNTFQKDKFNWIHLKPKIENDWNQSIRTLEGHSDGVSSVAFSRNSALIASASYDRTVRIWRADTGECTRILEGHSDWVRSVTFSRDSALIASASVDTTIHIWRVDTGECTQTYNLGIISKSLSFNPDGSHLITEIGAIIIHDAPPMQASIPTNTRCTGYGLSVDRCWITLDGRNLLWLPIEYRPNCVAISGSTVVLGTNAGRMSIIRFAR